MREGLAEVRMGRRVPGRGRRRGIGVVRVVVFRRLEVGLVGVVVMVRLRRRRRGKRVAVGVVVAVFLAVTTLAVGSLAVETLAVLLLYIMLLSPQLLDFLLRVDLIDALFGVLTILQTEAYEGGWVVHVLIISQSGSGLQVAVHIIGLVVAAGLFGSEGMKSGYSIILATYDTPTELKCSYMALTYDD